MELQKEFPIAWGSRTQLEQLSKTKVLEIAAYAISFCSCFGERHFGTTLFLGSCRNICLRMSIYTDFCIKSHRSAKTLSRHKVTFQVSPLVNIAFQNLDVQSIRNRMLASMVLLISLLAIFVGFGLPAGIIDSHFQDFYSLNCFGALDCPACLTYLERFCHGGSSSLLSPAWFSLQVCSLSSLQTLVHTIKEPHDLTLVLW